MVMICASCKHLSVLKNKAPCSNCNYWNNYVYFDSIHGRVNIIKPKNNNEFNMEDKMFKKWR